MSGNLIGWLYSGAGVGGGAQTDPALSIGSFWSISSFTEFQGQFTAATTAATNRRALIDSGRIGDGDDAHNAKVLTVITGAASLHHSRIIDFINASGTFVLQDPVPADVAINDYYRVWDTGNLFPTLTAQQSIDGREEWRIIYFANFSGTNGNVRFYIDDRDSGGARVELLNSDTNVDQTFTLPDAGLTSPLTDPGGHVDSALELGNEFANYEKLQTPVASHPVPTPTIVINDNTRIALLLKRTVPANSKRRRFASTIIVAETDIAGGDPDPLVSPCAIVWGTDGPTSVPTVNSDRELFVGGGSRIEGNVIGQETGLPIAVEPVEFSIAGLGSIASPSRFVDTDENGDAAVTYLCPTSDSAIGQTVDLRMSVAGGEEVV